MAFDPDAYLAGGQSPQPAPSSGFDPDAYLAGSSVPVQTPAPRESKLKLPEYKSHSVRAFGRGATLGLTDVAGAALNAAVTPRTPGQTFADAYAQAKNDINAQRDQFREEKPVMAYGSELVGALAPALLTGGATAPESAVTTGKALVPAAESAGAIVVPAAESAGSVATALKALAQPVVKASEEAGKTLIGKVAKGIGSGALQGGVYGASQAKAGEAESGGEEGSTLGAIIGGGIPIVGNALSRVISPIASQNTKLQMLLGQGATPTIGQALGGRVNAMEEKLSSLPVMGDMINVARQKAAQSIEPIAFNRALSKVGEKLPAGMSGRDAISHTENVLKQKYDEVLNRIGAIIPDEKFSANVANLEGMVNGLKMPQEAKDKFAFVLDKVKSSIDENGVITSDAYKALESALGSDARALAGEQSIYSNKIAPAVSQIKAELSDMLQRQAGSAAKELKDVNSGWANFKILQKAASGVGAEEGRFTPAQLQSAVKAADKSKDKSAFARGNALMQDLSEAAKTVMTNKVPNSFTADRALLDAGAMMLGHAVNPVIPAGLLGGAALYSAPVQRALVSLAAKRGESAPVVAQAVRNALEGYGTQPAVIASGAARE